MLKNHEGCVKKFLEHPEVDVNCKDEKGRTLLTLSMSLSLSLLCLSTFFYVSFPFFTLSFSLSLKQLFHFSIFSVFPYLFTYLQYIFPSFLFSSLYFSLLSKENIQLSSLNLPTPFYSMYVISPLLTSAVPSCHGRNPR